MCMYFILSSDVKVLLSAAHNATFCSNELIFFPFAVSIISFCGIKHLVWRIIHSASQFTHFWLSMMVKQLQTVLAWLTFLTFSRASLRLGIGCSKGRGSGKRGHIISELALRPISSSDWWMSKEKRGKNKCQIKSTGRRFVIRKSHLIFDRIQYPGRNGGKDGI